MGTRGRDRTFRGAVEDRRLAIAASHAALRCKCAFKSPYSLIVFHSFFVFKSFLASCFLLCLSLGPTPECARSLLCRRCGLGVQFLVPPRSFAVYFVYICAQIRVPGFHVLIVFCLFLLCFACCRVNEQLSFIISSIHSIIH